MQDIDAIGLRAKNSQYIRPVRFIKIFNAVRKQYECETRTLAVLQRSQRNVLSPKLGLMKAVLDVHRTPTRVNSTSEMVEVQCHGLRDWNMGAG